MPERGEHPEAELGVVATSDRAVVWEVMSPLGRTVCAVDTLAEVSRRLSGQADTVVLVNAAGRAVRTITASDVDHFAHQDPLGWWMRRCAELGEIDQAWVRPEHPVEGVVWHYRHGVIRPLLVFNGEEAVGVVHPSAIFQWCAAHFPSVLPALSQRAAEQATAAQPARKRPGQPATEQSRDERALQGTGERIRTG